MQDTTTKKPIHVRDGGISGPYLKVPFTQIDDIRRLLDEHRIRYEVSDHIISFNGGPEMAWVNFGRGGDATVIQKIFDDAECLFCEKESDSQPSFFQEDSATQDTATKKPIHVRDGGIAGPYLKVPHTQIDDIQRLLDEHRIRYEVSEHITSFNGGPEMAWVKFGRGGDATVIQKIFDEAE